VFKVQYAIITDVYTPKKLGFGFLIIELGIYTLTQTQISKIFQHKPKTSKYLYPIPKPKPNPKIFIPKPKPAI